MGHHDEGHVFSRLFAYLKPYKHKLVVALILVLLVTAFDLAKPMLIGEAIDIYIEGYNHGYAISEIPTDLTFEGNYLTEDLTQGQVFSQIVAYENDYYYFSDLSRDEFDRLNEITKSPFHASSTKEGLLLEEYQGTLLTKADLKQLRSGDLKGLIHIGIQYVLLLGLTFVGAFGQTWILQLTGQNIIYTIRKQLFHHIHQLPLAYHDAHPVGSTVTRVTNDVESLHEMYANILVRLFRNVVKVIGFAVVMVALQPTLALFTFALIPVIVLVTVYFRTLSRKIHRLIRTKISALNTFLSENISGMKLIQLFANEKRKMEEFQRSSKDLYQAAIKQIMVFSVFRPLVYMIAQLAIAFVLYMGSRDVFSGVLSVGTFYVFINYISNFYEPVQELAEQFTTLQNALASAEKIFTVLDEKNTIEEVDHPESLGEVSGKIEFKHVWFAYKEDEYVLKDVSFVIEPGQKVAFVGATGAGKSSILNLVGRYYDIQKGEILIDGHDIRKLSTAEIRRAIGQVQQDVFIFTGDITSNITLNNSDMTKEQVQAASTFVNADHFISQLPNQYHEPVSERGSTLSSGQRQLLSFARTLAYNPKILVMDEATANIDTETEGLIQNALEKLMAGRTTIMVAHRLSTIQHADKIIVLDHGEIKESGNHQELLKQDGIYKKLYNLQLSNREGLL